MKIIVTEISAGIAYYPELAKWVRGFDLDPDDSMFEPLTLMEGDPDIIRCDGYKKFFFDVEIDGTKFILTSDEVNEKEKQMLSRFHNDGERALHFDQIEYGTWEIFDSLPNAIAWRGGKGYYYGVNNYLS